MPRNYRRDLPASPGDWAERAACARTKTDMGLFSNASPQAVESRRLVCSGCPVLDDCKAWALTVPDPAFGHMAGGLAPAERSQIRRWGTSR